MPDRIPQPMRPHGFAGRIFGVVMERLSEPNYRWVLRQLVPNKPNSYLEIGFGTGRLAEMVAKELQPRRIVGVDPSALMLKTAQRRLRRFVGTTDIALTPGDDAMLASLAGAFDAIVATHSFQFWSAPDTTLARIREILAPSGLFVLVLRRHISSTVTPWIANPISSSGDELGGTRKALAAAGLRIVTDETLRTGSHGIVATVA